MDRPTSLRHAVAKATSDTCTPTRGTGSSDGFGTNMGRPSGGPSGEDRGPPEAQAPYVGRGHPKFTQSLEQSVWHSPLQSIGEQGSVKPACTCAGDHVDDWDSCLEVKQ